MRVRVLSAIVAVLAVAVLAVHLAVPFAQYEVAEQMGVPAGSGTYTIQDIRELRDAETEAGRSYAVAPGTGFGYMLGGALVLVLGTIGFLVSSFMSGNAAIYTQLGTGSLSAIGAAMSLHSNGLWAGRGVASLIHLLGWDAPPAAYKDDYLAPWSRIDIVSAWFPISPAIIVVLLVAIIVLLGKAWIATVRDERNMRLMARRHHRIAIIATATLVAALLLPWVVQVMQHGLTEGADPADEDPFFWSAYDVLFLREVSEDEAQRVGEGGLRLFEGLSIAVRALIYMGMASIVAPLLAIGGKQVESDGNPVFGRMMENVGLVTLLTFSGIIIVAFLGAFVLQDANEMHPSMTTALPLLFAIPAGIGIVFAGLVSRDVVAEETDLVADDFPEPVVYD